MPRGGRRPSDRGGRYPPILVAASHEGLRGPLVEYLAAFGFQVEQAAHGNEVRARIAATLPHVILTEGTLPALPAWRLSHWLAVTWRTSRIPVIVMMETGDDLHPELLLRQPAAILVNPCPLATVLDAVRQALRANPPVRR